MFGANELCGAAVAEDETLSERDLQDVMGFGFPDRELLDKIIKNEVLLNQEQTAISESNLSASQKSKTLENIANQHRELCAIKRYFSEAAKHAIDSPDEPQPQDPTGTISGYVNWCGNLQCYLTQKGFRLFRLVKTERVLRPAEFNALGVPVPSDVIDEEKE
jgi:hypothetical protein